MRARNTSEKSRGLRCALKNRLASEKKRVDHAKLRKASVENAARAPHRSPLASNTLSNARKSKRGAKRCSYTGKKQVVSQDDQETSPYHGARARPARRRWRRSVRPGVYFGRASRLRRPRVARRAPRRSPRPRRAPPPPPPGASPSAAPTAAPTVPGWRANGVETQRAFKKPDLEQTEQVWSRQRCASAALRPTSGPDNATALGRGPCDARLARGLPRRAHHHMAAHEQQS